MTDWLKSTGRVRARVRSRTKEIEVDFKRKIWRESTGRRSGLEGQRIRADQTVLEGWRLKHTTATSGAMYAVRPIRHDAKAAYTVNQEDKRSAGLPQYSRTIAVPTCIQAGLSGAAKSVWGLMSLGQPEQVEQRSRSTERRLAMRQEICTCCGQDIVEHRQLARRQRGKRETIGITDHNFGAQCENCGGVRHGDSGAEGRARNCVQCGSLEFTVFCINP
ncbi:hypothetical protein FB451DRAFT_1180569 [Mycena latifolia]|nr:hypothetical protein FB451DRAFT_1180569 [Mycena latifolia]